MPSPAVLAILAAGGVGTAVVLSKGKGAGGAKTAEGTTRPTPDPKPQGTPIDWRNLAMRPASGGLREPQIQGVEIPREMGDWLLEQKFRAEFNRLSCEGKREAYAAAKERLPDLRQLDPCSASFEEVAEAVGAAGGQAGCVALGAEPQAAKVCAWVGGWLGKELGPVLDDAWDKVAEWSEDAAEEVKGAAESVWENTIGGWF